MVSFYDNIKCPEVVYYLGQGRFFWVFGISRLMLYLFRPAGKMALTGR